MYWFRLYWFHMYEYEYFSGVQLEDLNLALDRVKEGAPRGSARNREEEQNAAMKLSMEIVEVCIQLYALLRWCITGSARVRFRVSLPVHARFP